MEAVMKKLIAISISLAIATQLQAAQAPSFENTTIQNFPDGIRRVDFQFWTGAPDINNDGCEDAIAMSHSDYSLDPEAPAPPIARTAFFRRIVRDNKCTTTFTEIPFNKNYVQPVPEKPRNTSRLTFGNWYNNPTGLWSYYGADADLANSAKYLATGVTNGVPAYATKTNQCQEGLYCMPVEYNGEIAFISRTGLRNQAGTKIVNIDASIVADRVGVTLFDANGDSYKDLVYPMAGGYFAWDSVALVYNWVANTFPELPISPITSCSHCVVLDYDNDGDSDMWIGQAVYSADNNSVRGVVKGYNVFKQVLLRNDNGIFVDTTVSAGLEPPNLLKNAYFYTSYANSFAADINNDGNMDIVFGAEREGFSITGGYAQIAFLLNNGDGTFAVSRPTNFGPGKNVSNSGGRPWTGRADFNQDGKIDIIRLQGNTGCTQDVRDCKHQSLAIWTNTISNQNTWIGFRVQGLTSDGIGAYVTFRESGTDTILCSMEIGVFNSSYQNLVAHCGLGDATKVDATVRHANGGPVHEFVNLDVNRNVIFRINGEIVKNYIPGSGAPLLAQADGTESEIPDEPEDNTRLLELQNERQLLLERLSDLQDILESLERDIEELENQ
jgi:hypothetical protein